MLESDGMNVACVTVSSLLLAMVAALADPAGADRRLAELDAYWAEVARTVKAGDFDGYRATCHPLGVLVSGSKQTSYPLSEALERWRPEFEDTASGERASEVAFRFATRWGDGETAHETGIFRYRFRLPGEELQTEHIHFEALLTKEGGVWKILMEYQKGIATEAEWEGLGG